MIPTLTTGGVHPTGQNTILPIKNRINLGLINTIRRMRLTRRYPRHLMDSLDQRHLTEVVISGQRIMFGTIQFQPATPSFVPQFLHQKMVAALEPVIQD